MIVEHPKTIEEYKGILEALYSLMSNPYCDYNMFMDIVERYQEVEEIIKQLENGNSETIHS